MRGGKGSRKPLPRPRPQDINIPSTSNMSPTASTFSPTGFPSLQQPRSSFSEASTVVPDPPRAIYMVPFNAREVPGTGFSTSSGQQFQQESPSSQSAFPNSSASFPNMSSAGEQPAYCFDPNGPAIHIGYYYADPYYIQIYVPSSMFRSFSPVPYNGPFPQGPPWTHPTTTPGIGAIPAIRSAMPMPRPPPSQPYAPDQDRIVSLQTQDQGMQTDAAQIVPMPAQAEQEKYPNGPRHGETPRAPGDGIVNDTTGTPRPVKMDEEQEDAAGEDSEGSES